MPDVWEAAATVAKCALYFGVLGAAGTVFAALLLPLARYRGTAFGFAGLGLIASLAGFMLRGAMLTGDASGLTDPEMLGLLWQTPPGTALTYRVCGLLILIAGLFGGRRGLLIASLGGFLAVRSFDHVGHIAGQYSPLLDLALTLHLICISFWIGVLAPLRRLALGADTRGQAAVVGHRFGQIATVAVPVPIVAGGFMAYQLVGSVAALLGTGYGLALIAKIAGVAALLMLAAGNKLRYVPAMRRDSPAAAKGLARAINLEWCAVSAIFATTAVMTTNLGLPA